MVISEQLHSTGTKTHWLFGSEIRCNVIHLFLPYLGSLFSYHCGTQLPALFLTSCSNFRVMEDLPPAGKWISTPTCQFAKLWQFLGGRDFDTWEGKAPFPCWSGSCSMPQGNIYRLPDREIWCSLGSTNRRWTLEIKKYWTPLVKSVYCSPSKQVVKKYYLF